jgi:DNA-binding XRE family transcriptional regulator
MSRKKCLLTPIQYFPSERGRALANSTLKRLLVRLRQLRQIHGVSQEGFSELSGISYKYYPAIEAGRLVERYIAKVTKLQ